MEDSDNGTNYIALTPGQSVASTVTLTLPEDFELAEGEAAQPVPPLPRDATSHNSPVTWKVKAPGHEGKYTLKVQSSTGVSQTQTVTIRANRIFN